MLRETPLTWRKRNRGNPRSALARPGDRAATLLLSVALLLGWLAGAAAIVTGGGPYYLLPVVALGIAVTLRYIAVPCWRCRCDEVTAGTGLGDGCSPWRA
jgi:hypothetical protein